MITSALPRAAARVVAAALTCAGLLGCGGEGDRAVVDGSAALGSCGAGGGGGDEGVGAPDDLACTGLYDDVGAKILSRRARPFAPAVPFWSDGADKRRYIDLPDGQAIDTTSMDDWRFPVGTKVWKEFTVGGRRVETRFLHKVRADRWVQAAYQWAPDEASAMRVDGASLVVDGAPYEIPRTSACNDCHRGRKDRLLGFEAVSLAQPGAEGLDLGTLVAEGRLSAPPAQTSVTLADDGTGASGPALAWLHVNCGTSCHTGTSLGTGYGTGLQLRLGWDEITSREAEAWAAVRSTVGASARTPAWAGQPRIAPGDPDASVLLTLLASRGEAQMPPIATRVVDDAGRRAVEAWIAAMPRPREPDLRIEVVR